MTSDRTRELERDWLVAPLSRHVQANASRYLGCDTEAPATVRVLATETRSYSRLYRLAVEAAGRSQQLFVKVSTDWSDTALPGGSRVADRPRLAPLWASDVKFALEHRALLQIHRHFTSLGDRRFRAVRVFDAIPEHRALVMETIDEPSLRSLSLQAGRSRSEEGAARLREAFRNAGAWLRIYHTLPADGDLQSIDSGRDHFVAFIGRLCAYLARKVGQEPFFTWLASALSTRAKEWLPERAPVGLAHGDFAMRNVLVGAENRVVVLDTLASHRACIYRDLAYFLSDLECSWPAALSRGAFSHSLHAAGYREAILAGYFAETAPDEMAIRVYEVQMLLERWASAVWHASRPQSLLRRSLKRARLPLLSAYYRRMIRDRLITDAPPQRKAFAFGAR
ncbi:MAG TPA: phosphotransferase [Vicinamibacterales bacterium]|nr:phosphotransferase [Vicinamibacterales bacterium]